MHPTEVYVVLNALDKLAPQPAIYHYAVDAHALEQRYNFTAQEWQTLYSQLPAKSFLVALSSIYWRESWKYGERAFRYCNHDLGHALGALAIAAACMGWRIQLLDGYTDEELQQFLGIEPAHPQEPEYAECLVLVCPRESQAVTQIELGGLLNSNERSQFKGQPNQLSPEHCPWPIIDDIYNATRKQERQIFKAFPKKYEPAAELCPATQISAYNIIRRRRSAVKMDAKTNIDKPRFYHLLQRLAPAGNPTSFDCLNWPPWFRSCFSSIA